MCDEWGVPSGGRQNWFMSTHEGRDCRRVYAIRLLARARARMMYADCKVGVVFRRFGRAAYAG